MEPKATLFVQIEEDEARDGDVEALEIDFPSASIRDAPYAEANIEAAISKEGVVMQMHLRLSGVSYSDIQLIREHGFLRVDAGYQGDTIAPVQPVFYGKFSGMDYDVEAGKRVWTIHSNPFPIELAKIPISFSEPSILIGDAILKVFKKMGVASSASQITPLAFGDMSTLGLPSVATNLNVATIENWNTEGRNGYDILHDLINLLVANIKATHKIERRIGLIPEAANGFVYHVIDFDTSLPFQIIDYDVDTPLVISAGTLPVEEIPVESTLGDEVGEGEFEILTPAEKLKDLKAQHEKLVAEKRTDEAASIALQFESLQSQVNLLGGGVKRQYKIIVAFDPRITLGTVIMVKDKELGADTPVQITSYNHNLNGRSSSWRTEAVGDILAGVFFDNAD